MSNMAALVAGRPYTRADLEHTPDDGRRYELIDGVMVVSAAPGLRHQNAVVALTVQLYNCCPAGFLVVTGPFGVALADDTELQPDIIVGRQSDFTEREIVAPALVVEVLSPSTRLFDTNVKRARFERASIPSYWIIDPIARPAEATLVVWELGEDGGYRQVAKAVGYEEAVLTQPYPVSIVPADLVR